MRQTNFGEDHRKYTESRSQYALAMVLLSKITHRGRVLDVGSGLGEFADLLVNHGYDVFCVEGAEEFVVKQRQRGLKIQQVDLENNNLPFEDNSFDIIFSLDVIEHLWNTKHYLLEINRCIKSDGFFIISTINYNYWKYRLLHLKGKMEDFVYSSRHKKFYTLNSLPIELRPLFNIDDVAYYSRWATLTHMIFPNLLAQQFAFLCRPNKNNMAR